MHPSQTFTYLNHEFYSAYPTTEIAKAWVLCVPGTGYGWHTWEGRAEVYGASYTGRAVAPAVWNMYARTEGDETLRAYIETFTSTNAVPLATVPDNATAEWVEACVSIAELARRIGVSGKTQAELDTVALDLRARFPVSPESSPIDRAIAGIRRDRRAIPADTFRDLRVEHIRHTLERTGRPAVLRTPKISAAIEAIEALGVPWLFENIGTSTRARWRVVLLDAKSVRLHQAQTCYRDEPDALKRLAEQDAEETKLAREVLTPEEFVTWRANEAWRRSTERFAYSHEGSRGPDPERLFYEAMLGYQGGPWAWPLIGAATEIFGEGVAHAAGTTFVPLVAPWTYDEGTTVGVVEPSHVFPYESDSAQYGDLPEYRPAQYYTWDQLVVGVVVDLGGRRIRVRYPIVEKFLADRCTQEYPDATAVVELDNAEGEALTPFVVEEPRDSSHPVQFFGAPSWQQSQRYPVYRGRVGSVLFTLHDGWGDCGSTNIMFCADETTGIPVRLFHEASCG